MQAAPPTTTLLTKIQEAIAKRAVEAKKFRVCVKINEEERYMMTLDPTVHKTVDSFIS